MEDVISSRHHHYVQKIQELRLIDDDFMRIVFKDEECVKHIIRSVLQEDYQDIIDCQVQYDMKNLQGRSHVIDLLAVDTSGRYINVEFQKYDQKAMLKRARRHVSLLDVNMSRTRERFEKLKDIVVIFITEKDELGNGLPITHIHRYMDETKEKVEDGTEIIYIPANIRDGSALDLMKEDLLEKDYRKIHSKALRERVRYYKESEEGQREMCKIFEDIRNEGRNEGYADGEMKGFTNGRNQGIEEGKESIIKKMLMDGMSIEKINMYSGISIDKIENIKKDMIYV